MGEPLLDERPREAPALRSAPFIGAAVELQRDFLGTVTRTSREVGDVALISAGPPGWRRTFYLLSSPDAVTQVLGQPDLYTKRTSTYDVVRTALGNGMLTSEGEQWRRQRRFLAPIFTPRRIAGEYAAIMVDESASLGRQWADIAAAGGTIDAHSEMIGVTSRIIGRILFGADMTHAIPRIMSVSFVNEALLRRGLMPHALPMWLPTPNNRRLAAGVAEIRGVVSDIVTARRAQPGTAPAQDMLGLLLAARDDENAADRLSDQEVADQVLIFMLAGHETTATALACALFELARSASWQQVVQQEIDEVLGDRPPTAADVGRLTWTDRVVRETMRLYPSAHSVGRHLEQEDVIGGYRIPAGADVVISPWVVHRSPRVWADPDVFDPARFDVPPGSFPGGHRHAWIPFGAGPHTCVGMQLALLEAPLVLAAILQAFRLQTDMTSLPLVAAVSLRPAAPVPIRLKVRDG